MPGSRGGLIRALGLGCLGCLACLWLFINIGEILSAADQPEQADVVLCLSGGPDRVNKAAELLAAGLSERVVVTTAGAYRQMLAAGVEPERIIQASWSASSTYQEGRLARELLGEDGAARRVLVVTDPYHLFRTRLTIGHFFSGSALRFSFISSQAPHLEGFWWSNMASRRFVLSELVKIPCYWLRCQACRIFGCW